jgi:hypothetical protein
MPASHNVPVLRISVPFRISLQSGCNTTACWKLCAFLFGSNGKKAFLNISGLYRCNCMLLTNSTLHTLATCQKLSLAAGTLLATLQPACYGIVCILIGRLICHSLVCLMCLHSSVLLESCRSFAVLLYLENRDVPSCCWIWMACVSSFDLVMHTNETSCTMTSAAWSLHLSSLHSYISRETAMCASVNEVQLMSSHDSNLRMHSFSIKDRVRPNNAVQTGMNLVTRNSSKNLEAGFWLITVDYQKGIQYTMGDVDSRALSMKPWWTQKTNTGWSTIANNSWTNIQ